MGGASNKRFHRLIEPHLEVLFRAAWRLTRNRADAEDLVQDCCMRACERIDAISESLPVKAWLLRVMHNLFVDGRRRASRSPIGQAQDLEPAGEAACPAPTPEESLENRQRLLQLENAWSRLERGHRALLALRAEGYTLPEISTITNIPMDALTMRLYRARQNLTRCLREVQAPSKNFKEASK